VRRERAEKSGKGVEVQRGRIGEALVMDERWGSRASVMGKD
jgi:hypothetical protein